MNEVAALGALATPWLLTAAGIFLRLTGLALGMPVISDASVPGRARAALLVWMTLLLLIGTGLTPTPVPATPFGWVVLLLPELLLGAGMGLFIRVVTAAAIFTGQAVSTMMGLGFASAVDPATGVMTDTTGRILRIFAAGLFLLSDAHLMAVSALRDSLIMVPFGSFDLVTLSQAAEGLGALGAALFHISLRLSAPALVGVLMVYVVLAVITKVAPQMNLFAFGFVITIPTGLVLLMASTPQTARIFLDAYQGAPPAMLLWLTTGSAG